MQSVAVNLPGVTFNPGAIDEAGKVVYGYFRDATRQGVAAIDLQRGRLAVVSIMHAAASGVIWMSMGGTWLVWVQGESQDVLGDWTIQAWNTQTHDRLQLATSQLPDGTYLTGELTFPAFGDGYVAWNQPTSQSSADLRVYRFASRSSITLDTGRLSSPVIADGFIVWAKYEAGSSLPSLHFANASDFLPAAVPTELAGTRPINYLAGSSIYLALVGDTSTPAGNIATLGVDELALGRVAQYSSSSHYIQFPMLAGHFIVWEGPTADSVVDLSTGAGFDIALPGGLAGAGDTIIVARGASGTKGSVTSTKLAVLHPSSLGDIPTCSA